MIQRFQTYLTSPGLGPEVLRALIGSAGVRIVGMFFAFLVGVQLARALGAEGYGVYGLAMSIISLLAIPMQFGLPSLLTREIAAAEVKDNWAVIRGILDWSNRTVVMLSIAMTLLMLLALFLFTKQINNELRYTLLSGLLLMPFIALGNIRGAALRGLRHIVKGQFFELVLRPAMFSLLLFITSVLFAQGVNPGNAMGMHAVASIISFIVATILLKTVLQQPYRIAKPEIHAKAWWKSTLPMALTDGLRLLQGNLSILLLGVFSTTAMVGVFRVASSLGILLIMPVSLLHIVSATFFSRLYAAKDYQKLQQMLKWVAVAMFLGVICFTLPFFLIGEQIITYVFGTEFSNSNTPLLILSAGTVIGSAFGASVTLLNMTKHEKRVTRAFGLSLLLLGTVSIPFIMLWGVTGAALANSIAFISFSVLTWWDARSLLQLDTSLFSFIHQTSRFKQD